MTFSSQEILRGLSSLFMRTTGVISMLGSSYLGLSTKVILFSDALLNVTTGSPVVCKQMGFEAQPHGPVLRRDNVVLLCLISLGKHMLAISNIYFFKKNTCGQKHGSLNSRILSQLNSEIQLYQHRGHFPQTSAFPLITQGPLENQIWLL